MSKTKACLVLLLVFVCTATWMVYYFSSRCGPVAPPGEGPAVEQPVPRLMPVYSVATFPHVRCAGGSVTVYFRASKRMSPITVQTRAGEPIEEVLKRLEDAIAGVDSGAHLGITADACTLKSMKCIPHEVMWFSATDANVPLPGEPKDAQLEKQGGRLVVKWSNSWSVPAKYVLIEYAPNYYESVAVDDQDVQEWTLDLEKWFGAKVYTSLAVRICGVTAGMVPGQSVIFQRVDIGPPDPIETPLDLPLIEPEE